MRHWSFVKISTFALKHSVIWKPLTQETVLLLYPVSNRTIAWRKIWYLLGKLDIWNHYYPFFRHLVERGAVIVRNYLQI